MGGLGNQLFQYSAAKALAEKNDCKLYLDLSFLNDKSEKQDFTLREYELIHFGINDPIFEIRHRIFFKLIYYFSKLISFSFILRFLFKTKRISPAYYIDHLPGYKDAFFNNTSFTYLDGYFQSYMYFDKIINTVNGSLLPNVEVKFSDLFDVVDEEIDINNTVFVHVRRGDYANNAAINSVHGLCENDYYKKAFDFITDKLCKPYFFVFSDDVNAAKNLFEDFSLYYNIYFQRRQNLIKEFSLMSSCSNAIIANSSLSWWAAWLIKSESKIVISPKRWFMDSNLNNLTHQLIPENWIRL